MTCRVSSLRIRSKLQHCRTCEKSHVLQVMACVADHFSSCVATIPNNSTGLGIWQTNSWFFQGVSLFFSTQGKFHHESPKKGRLDQVGATPNPRRMNLKSIASWQQYPVATLTPPVLFDMWIALKTIGNWVPIHEQIAWLLIKENTICNMWKANFKSDTWHPKVFTMRRNRYSKQMNKLERFGEICSSAFG